MVGSLVCAVTCEVVMCRMSGIVVGAVLRAATILSITIWASAIVASSGRTGLHFICSNVILCISMSLNSSARVYGN